jgi:GntR family transcriptional regulator
MADLKYLRIADDLRSKIESGEMAPGSQLPTETELMQQYEASRNTIRDAIKMLITPGLVVTRAGQGRFVAEEIVPYVTTLTVDPVTGRAGGEGEDPVYIAEVEASGRSPTSSDPRVEIQGASRVVADALDIKEGDEVVSRHQQRFIDGTPWSLQTSFYDMTLAERAGRLIRARDIAEGTVAYLEATLHMRQARYRDLIRVRAPDEVETAIFKLPADGRVQVFEIFRVGFDQDDKPFRLTVTIYPADRNQFVINVEAPSPGRESDNHDQEPDHGSRP